MSVLSSVAAVAGLSWVKLCAYALVIAVIFGGGERVGEWRAAYVAKGDLAAVTSKLDRCNTSMTLLKQTDVTSAAEALNAANKEADVRLAAAMIASKEQSAANDVLIRELQKHANDKNAMDSRIDTVPSSGSCSLGADDVGVFIDASEAANAGAPDDPAKGKAAGHPDQAVPKARR